MIDLIDIKIDIDHMSFGNERIVVNEISGSEKAKNFSIKIPLYAGGTPIIVTSMDNGKAIAIRACPLKAFQGHNVFGTDNVLALALKLIRNVLSQRRIRYTPEQWCAWQRGEITLEALDITYRFELPENTTATLICEHMLRRVGTTFKPAWLTQGVGVRLQVPGRNAEWVFYDKRKELNDKRLLARTQLEAVIGNDSAPVWNALLATAGNSIRAELKLSKAYLQREQLDAVAAWSPAVPQQVYYSELAKLRLGAAASIEVIRDSIADLQDKKLMQTLLLWMHGEDMRSLFALSTLKSRRREILDLIGVDILHDVPSLQRLKLSEIFAKSNACPTFPAWCNDYPAAAFRGRQAPAGRQQSESV